MAKLLMLFRLLNENVRQEFCKYHSQDDQDNPKIQVVIVLVPWMKIDIEKNRKIGSKKCRNSTVKVPLTFQAQDSSWHCYCSWDAETKQS